MGGALVPGLTRFVAEHSLGTGLVRTGFAPPGTTPIAATIERWQGSVAAACAAAGCGGDRLNGICRVYHLPDALTDDPQACAGIN